MRKYKTEVQAKLRKLARLLNDTRGFLLIFALVTAAGSILAWVDQGQDLLRSITDVNGDHTSGFSWQVFWLCVSVFALGFQGWFWSRTIADAYSDQTTEGFRGAYLKWTPRLLGIIPFALLFVALWKVQSPHALPAWILAGMGAVFLIFVIMRRPMAQRMETAAYRLAVSGRKRAAKVIDGSLRSLKPVIFWGGVTYAAIAMIIVIYDPVTFSVYFGPAAVVLVACALLIPVLTTLSLIGNAFYVRTTATLFVLLVVFSLWVDNHEVRHSETDATAQQTAIRARPTLRQAFTAWRGQFPSDASTPIPIVFIASAGGASRAGYWTAAVMSRLERITSGQFSRHVFAISSISGGSLGVGGFLSTINDEKAMALGGPGNLDLPKTIADFTGQDYLSPALAGGLFPDLLQRFFPLSVFPDRSAALEKGWEAGWRNRCASTVCDFPDRFERDFLSLWSDTKGRRWNPSWLIGGALEEDGRPILTSNIDFGDAIDAWDFHHLAQRDVRLSTAILNGARFPFVSSSGTIRNPTLPQKIEAVHIVDGGYFDAAGVEAIRGLARSMFAKGGVATDANVIPIFLLISNDGVNPPFADLEKPNISSAAVPVACRGQSVKAGCPGDAGLATIAPDLFGPLQGLFRSRGAHGEKLKSLLYLDPPTHGGRQPQIFTLDLCSLAVPMNWALSPNAKNIVDDLLDKRVNRKEGGCAQRNDRDYDALVALLK